MTPARSVSRLEALIAARPAMEADLAELVTLETPSGDEPLLDVFCDALCARVESLGGRVKRTRAPGHGTHVAVTLGDPAGSRPVLLLGHYDTVWPRGTTARNPVTTAGGRLSGPGAFDMKAGIVQALAALGRLHAEAALPPVTLLCTCDEEAGSPSSRELIADHARRASAVLVLEPSLDGALKTARKGVARYRVEVRGRSAHAGLDPGAGVDAIAEACTFALAAHALARPAEGTTVSVGTIAGGTGWNVIPAGAVLEVDARAVTAAEAARVDRALHAIPPTDARAGLAVSRLAAWPPMERSPAGAALFSVARECAAGLGIDLEERAAGGASDGNLCAAVGAAVLDGLGAVGGGAHADDEWVDTAAMPVRAALLAELIVALS